MPTPSLVLEACKEKPSPAGRALLIHDECSLTRSLCLFWLFVVMEPLRFRRLKWLRICFYFSEKKSTGFWVQALGPRTKRPWGLPHHPSSVLYTGVTSLFQLPGGGGSGPVGLSKARSSPSSLTLSPLKAAGVRSRQRKLKERSYGDILSRPARGCSDRGDLRAGWLPGLIVSSGSWE